MLISRTRHDVYWDAEAHMQVDKSITRGIQGSKFPLHDSDVRSAPRAVIVKPLWWLLVS
jgi:hypothetical protein